MLGAEMSAEKQQGWRRQRGLQEPEEEIGVLQIRPPALLHYCLGQTIPVSIPVKITPMKTLSAYVKDCVLIAIGCCLSTTGFARSERWSDVKGAKFEGEPAEVIGPLALFSLAGHGRTLIPLNTLSPQDCVRFSEQLRSVPEPAADWAKSTTQIGSEIYDHVLQRQDAKLVRADLKGTREPRFYILYFASTSEGNSWEMLRQSETAWPSFQRAHPSLVEGLMFGVNNSTVEQINMATETKVPYLVARLNEESNMSAIGGLAPGIGYGMVVTNCNGVPLFLGKGDSTEDTKKIMGEFDALLNLLDPNNTEAWAAELYYWKAVQPALHATDKCEPRLIGDPLSATKLTQLGAKRFDATIDISAGGTVTGVTLTPDGELPKSLVLPISEALKGGAQFVPAVDHGKFVDGKYHYHFQAS